MIHVPKIIVRIDRNGKKIAEKKTLIAKIKANDDAHYDATFPENSKIAAGDIKVLNATPA